MSEILRVCKRFVWLGVSIEIIAALGMLATRDFIFFGLLLCGAVVALGAMAAFAILADPNLEERTDTTP